MSRDSWRDIAQGMQPWAYHVSCFQEKRTAT
jgi:hypothetical protein